MKDGLEKVKKRDKTKSPICITIGIKNILDVRIYYIDSNFKKEREM